MSCGTVENCYSLKRCMVTRTFLDTMRDRYSRYAAMNWILPGNGCLVKISDRTVPYRF